MSKTNDYVVGYRCPPKHSRFSKDNQPVKQPRKLPPRPEITMIELDKQPVTIKQSNGLQITLTAADAGREKLIDKALHGDMRAIKRVYRNLDAEFEAWAENPRYKAETDELRKLRRALTVVQDRLRAPLNELLARGLIEQITENEYRIAPWVTQAYERRQASRMPDQWAHRANRR